MLKNYFKIAWRNLIRNKVFSIINIAGLGLGITCSLLIMFWVQDEQAVDGFHQHKERLYVIYQREYADGETGASYITAGLLGEELKRVIPEVQYAAGYMYDQQLFRTGKKVLRAHGAFAGNDFFCMFSFTILNGNPATALAHPASIVISKTMAIALFGNPAAAIGKPLRYGGTQDFTVTAVFDDFPENSSLKFSYIINWQAFLDQHGGAKRWDAGVCHTAVMLNKDARPVGVSAKIKKFLDDYYINQGPGLRVELDMQRFSEQYLNSNFENGYVSGGRIEYVRIFSIAAVFVLLIACINFMNLATARSAKRAKEIGVRKSAGAGRAILIGQFICEALLLSFLAMAFALALVYLLLPSFNTLTGKQMALPVTQLSFWSKVFLIGMLTGFIAGSYPALFLSSLRPVKVLKGTLGYSKGTAVLRKGLVIFQFSLSILLIIGTLVVSRQINYIQTKNLGYNKENLIRIPLEGDLSKQYLLFKEHALQLPGIRSVSRMTGSPVMAGNYQDAVEWEGMESGYRPTFAIVNVGYDFTNAMGIEIVEGRDFSVNFSSDTTGFVINESAAVKMGYKNPVGKRVALEDGRRGQIIGVVKDFHLASLHDPIYPLIVAFGEKAWGNILVRTEKGKTEQGLASLEHLCKQLNPKFPFSYEFSDMEYQRLYSNEQVVKKLSNSFALMAIFISCIGLLGLSIFTAERRMKEIGVRKVLGASVSNIAGLLSKDYIKLVLIGFMIAVPLAWYVMNHWLDDFAYRIELQWWMFAIPGLLAIIVALLVVGSESVKAALMNPVKSLRSE